MAMQMGETQRLQLANNSAQTERQTEVCLKAHARSTAAL
jgi:hypothetical protein